MSALATVLCGAAVFMLPEAVSQKSYLFIFVVLSATVSVGTLSFVAMPPYYMMTSAVTLLRLALLFCFRYAGAGDGFFAKRKIALAMAEPATLESAQVEVSIALGHALYPDDGSSLSELLRVADQRM